MIAVTGATGKLGRLVVEDLLKVVPAEQIIAAVRDPGKAADFAARGVDVRRADYNELDTLLSALDRADRLLLISTNDPTRTVAQHTAVIDAAKQVGVSLLAYTSVVLETARHGRPNRSSASREFRSPCCATASTPATTRHRSSRPSPPESSSAARGRAVRPPRPTPTTRQRRWPC
jgi:uncharacterized protein YbjT (DUF2867 family)